MSVQVAGGSVSALDMGDRGGHSWPRAGRCQKSPAPPPEEHSQLHPDHRGARQPTIWRKCDSQKSSILLRLLQ